MALGTNIKVWVVTDSEPNTVPCSNVDTAEDLCILLCKKHKISPLTRTLFALRIKGTDYFLSDNRVILSTNCSDYELRIRYKVPRIGELIDLDGPTFDYYFRQVRNDCRDNMISEIKYAEHKDLLLGLGVTDMYRAVIEDKTTQSYVEKNYKNYIPKIIVKNHGHVAKQRAQAKLPLMLDSIDKHNITFVKSQYLQQLHSMAPNYLSEEYRDIKWCNSPTGKLTVHLQVIPYGHEESGLRMFNTLIGEWSVISPIEDMVCMTRGVDRTLEIFTKKGVPKLLQFRTEEQLASLLSLCDGYYRLMVKWTYNLSDDDKTPSLVYLYRMRCHGPVGGAFCYRKLKEKGDNAYGVYTLRQCQDEYDVYYIDVCNESSKTDTYKLEYKDNHFIFKGKKYPTIAKLVADYNHKKDGEIYLEYCLPPSEYDQSQLLLCCEKRKKDVHINQSELHDVLKNTKHPICLRASDFFIYPDTENSSGITTTSKGIWKVDHKRTVDIAFRTLRPNKLIGYLQGFVELANNWTYLQEATIVKLYGITLNSPTAMVLEYIPDGPLDVYLHKERDKITLNHLKTVTISLAHALWHMSQSRIVHGYIRCRRLLVAACHSDRLLVKLTCPSLKPYTEEDKPWIPIEFLSKMSLAKLSEEGDIWAFATTLWEIFSYGKNPYHEYLSHERLFRMDDETYRLPYPEGCPKIVWLQMLQCWDMDPHSRTRPQEIMRNMTKMMHESKDNEPCIVSDNSEFAIGVNENQGFTNTSDTGSSTPLIQKSFNDSLALLNEKKKQNVHPATQSERLLKIITQQPNFENKPNQLYSYTSHSQTEYFSFVKQIGSGNYGEVFLGLTQNENKPVAVKKFKRDDDTNTKDYTNELKIMNSLYHANIVKIEGWWSHGQEFGIVMEFLDYGSLYQYLRYKKNKMTLWHQIKYAQDIASAMDYISAKGIVHRDLAARNILVANHKTVKISDFGLARMLDKMQDIYKIQSDKRLPMAWYAPEAAILPYDFSTKSDVWSYGVTVWEIFAKEDVPEFDTSKPEARADCFKPDKCEPQVYEQIMKRCWEYEPRNRPAFIDLVQVCVKLLKTLKAPDDV